jgi:hypothetical protein
MRGRQFAGCVVPPGPYCESQISSAGAPFAFVTGHVQTVPAFEQNGLFTGVDPTSQSYVVVNAVPAGSI